MKLYEPLPDSVIVGKRRIKVDLDFRNVLRMLEELSRSDLMPEAKDYRAAKCVCKRPKTGVTLAVCKLLFPHIGKASDATKITDWAQDAGLIRAAFRQSYGIDLNTAKLHWVTFSELLNAIPEATRYSEVLSIRAREIPAPTKYNKAEREWLIKAKASVALELTNEQENNRYERNVKHLFDGLFMWATKGAGNANE